MKEAKKQTKEIKAKFDRMSVDFVRILIQDEFKNTAAPLLEHFRRRAKKR